MSSRTKSQTEPEFKSNSKLKTQTNLSVSEHEVESVKSEHEVETVRNTEQITKPALDQVSESKKTKMPTHFELVGEFHDTFGHPQKSELFKDCFAVEPKLVPFRISLIFEEAKELKDAYNKRNTMDAIDVLVEMADALADMSYVINGTGQCLGINLDTLAEKNGIELYSSSRINPTNYLLNLLKVIHSKPEEKVFDFCSRIIEGGIERINCILNRFIVATFTTMYCPSSTKLSVQEIGAFLIELLDATYSLGHKLGFKMDQIFREVHRSNMTKVCSLMEDAEASVKFYVDEGRYKKPSIRKKGEYFVVFDEETSKILKNHKWETPNIKQFF